MGLAADDPRISRVAYAKLQGEGFEYFVRKYEVLLGRKSKSTELDIVLGDPTQQWKVCLAETAVLCSQSPELSVGIR